MKAKRIITFCLILLFSNAITHSFATPKIGESMAALPYSWNAAFDAVSYKVDIENQSTNEKYSQETANTTVTFNNIPSGNYNIIVTVIRADGSSYIVIADDTAL